MAIINISSILVDILLDISPGGYKPYLTTNRKGIKKLITQCMNAMYGIMLASIF